MKIVRRERHEWGEEERKHSRIGSLTPSLKHLGRSILKNVYMSQCMKMHWKVKKQSNPYKTGRETGVKRGISVSTSRDQDRHRRDKDRLSSTSRLLPDHAYGSPGPPCLSFIAVSATILPLTFPYWSQSDRAQLKPAIEPLMINSQFLLCPQKR